MLIYITHGDEIVSTSDACGDTHVVRRHAKNVIRCYE